MYIITICVVIIVILFILVKNTNKYYEKFNSGNKLPSNNNVSEASHIVADQNSQTNYYNIEPSSIIENGKTNFTVQNSYNSPILPDMKNDIDNLSYNSIKDVLYETKQLFNKNKKYLYFNDVSISKIDVHIETYIKIILYIYSIIKKLCNESFNVIIKSIDKLNTYVDLKDIYYTNINLTIIIQHPMDIVYKKKNLKIPINLTLYYNFDTNIDNVIIKDINVIH